MLSIVACSKTGDTEITSDNLIVQNMSQQELLGLLDQSSEEFVLLDVRSKDEFEESHLPNAINIPHLEILKDQAILEAYYGKKLVVHCHSGRRAGLVTDVLGKNSFASVHQLEGDFAAWKSSNLPLVR